MKQKVLFYIPILFLIPSIITLFDKGITIFPYSRNISYELFSDSDSENGSSIIKAIDESSDNISIQYKLKQGIRYPFAGIKFNANFENRYLDVSMYNTLKLKLKCSNKEKLSILMRLFSDEFSLPDNTETYLVLKKEIEVDDMPKTYNLKFDKFQVARWWLSKHNISEVNLQKPDFSRLFEISIGSADYFKLNTPVTIDISQISFHKDKTILHICTISFILMYYVAFILSSFFSKVLHASVIIPYKKIEVGDYLDEESEIVVSVINSRYKDSTLTVGMVGEECGILPVKVSTIIKQKFKMSFKQYLNKRRLEEAKKLIRETDQQIVIIARLAGYKSVSHFNRLFKEIEKISPNEYRKQYQD